MDYQLIIIIKHAYKELHSNNILLNRHDPIYNVKLDQLGDFQSPEESECDL